ncbi:hypothetical protein [Mycobacterium malmoense]|uniref:hypothetical protein n=1 Tax=Mycobacterium malmoense TaxID=1780 RepID=UPI0008F8C215|nr:hypothetical protein [Mycobacterium malmoense]OIN79765.1 hypothetical protein BMG05_16600 [Mycobacterium malmoense]
MGNNEADLIAEFSAGLHAVEIEGALDEFAHEVADHAKSLAPEFDAERDRRSEPGIGDPGDFKNSIKVETTGKPGRRRVISRDPKAIWAEMGSVHMPEYAVFAKTAAYFGGTGPVIEEGVQRAQSRLRTEVEKLAKLTAEGAGIHKLSAQAARVTQARIDRSAAFKAARPRRRRRY